MNIFLNHIESEIDPNLDTCSLSIRQSVNLLKPGFCI